MSILFSPIQFRSITLKNRIAVSPMCMYSAVDGHVQAFHETHYATLAGGGSGLVIVETSAVSPEGRISYADLGIWKDEHISGLNKITKLIKQQKAVPAIQLAHAGRKASAEVAWNGGRQIHEGENSWPTIAPSALPFHPKDKTPVEMSKSDIRRVISAFGDAAKRAYLSGFELIEIHAAHGYLIHEFYSPISNQRTDEYGGSFENRIRFLLEVVDSVQRNWPKELPLFVRLSATEWVADGWTIEDSVRLSSTLKIKGIDLVDCSSAANIPKAEIPVGPGYQVPLAEKIRKEAKISTGAVGLITDAQQAEDILQSQKADLILMARELLRNPFFPHHAAKILGHDELIPKQYSRGF